MAEIKGKERLLHIKRSTDSEYRRVGFLITNGYNTTIGFLPTTTRANDGFKTQEPIEIESVIPFTCVMFSDGDLATKVGYKEIREITEAGEQFSWKLEALNQNFTNFGEGHIESLSETADYADAVIFEGSIRQFGKPRNEADTTPPTTPLLNIPTTTQDGSSFTVNLSWTEATDNLAVAGYELRKTYNGKSEIIPVGDVLSFEDNGVAQGRTYAYNVRAFDTFGNYSGWSNKRTVLIPIPSSIPNQTTAKIYSDGTEKIYSNGIIKIY